MQDMIDLAIFASRLEAVCDEMGGCLMRAAFSANIKDRLDFSCAVFDEDGNLCAQAAHIPVHLGSMAYAMKGLVGRIDWKPHDVLVVNDPFLGGTHLPDITLVQPVFVQAQLVAFVACRAHHANIGAAAPGSMPVSTHIDEEGVLISPALLLAQGKPVPETFALLSGIAADGVSHQGLPLDFWAQISANELGVARLHDLLANMGYGQFNRMKAALFDYGERLSQEFLLELPNGRYCFEDYLDNDGVAIDPLRIQVAIDINDGKITVDFAGTADQVAGNVNCPDSVTAAAVYYVFKCLMPAQTPNCAGTFAATAINIPQGSLLNAEYPHAVAAGNVETSSRVVDVVLGALAKALPDLIPAASQGTMNNIAMGAKALSSERAQWDYYETIAGGMGAGPLYPGLSCVQTHMTNTLNTPIESVELEYPIRVRRYEMRHESGGNGEHRGGDGLCREYEFLDAAEVTLLTERRSHAPYGLSGGQDGLSGRNVLNGLGLPAKAHFHVKKGDRLLIETPGGGGWGRLRQA